ncbi:class I SAM-dependent methyltransferase [archaeon]|jgi:2-polyprenyl-3-methyl-5-hydroxy-6-metoxy-1,4-benzoquinol methylase|nr:class I SAM-dependent methyltransferase [archaeon]MBT4460640.1 class I SAM-dependent methyltransferase [archaeon]MBT4858007.1 class I SAM-dependent methyltransferase [archaeon]MBT6773671.1 class I SAM-dependent methyltransferase [archaeon]
MKQEKITDDVSKFYDVVWSKYIPEVEEQKKFLKRYLGLKNIKGKIILDAGCGTGVAAVSLKLLGAKEVYAIDISEGSLKTAKKLAKEHKVKITFKKENLLDLKLDKKFDVIHSFGVLHHTADCRLAFDNVLNLLKPKGKFYVALYLKTPLTFLQQSARYVLRKLPKQYWIPVSKAIRGLFVRGSKRTKRGFDDEGDMLDWFFVPQRTHHTPKELAKWFREHKMKSKLLIAKTGRFASTSNFMMVGWK